MVFKGLAIGLILLALGCDKLNKSYDPLDDVAKSGDIVRGTLAGTTWVLSSSIAKVDVNSSSGQKYINIQLFGDSIQAQCSDAPNFSRMVLIRVPDKVGTYDMSSASVHLVKNNAGVVTSTPASNFRLKIDSTSNVDRLIYLQAQFLSGGNPEEIKGRLITEVCDTSLDDIAPLIGSWTGTGTIKANSTSTEVASPATASLAMAAGGLAISVNWSATSSVYQRAGLSMTLGKVFESCKGVPYEVGTLTAGDLWLKYQLTASCRLQTDSLHARVSQDGTQLLVDVTSTNGLSGRAELKKGP